MSHTWPLPEIVTNLRGRMQIDTEGNDGEVLRGAESLLRSHRVAAIFYENNPGMQKLAGWSLARTVELLTRHGYHAYYFGQHKLLPLNAACTSEYVNSPWQPSVPRDACW